MKITAQSPATPIPAEVKTAKPGSRVSIWLKRIALGLAVGIATLVIAGAVYQVIATAIDQRALPPPGQMIDVGGYQMHLYCTGTNVSGSPTVILENGLGSTSSAWALVQPEVAKGTRVCSYDRAGTGWSEASSEPRDTQHIARELHTLLQNANIPGPYILVGWSMGGLYTRGYAEQYGDQVAGLVLVDSSHHDQWTNTSGGQKQFESNAQIYSVAPILARLGVMRIMSLRQADSGLPKPFNEELTASFAATKDWDAQSAEFLASPASMTQLRESKLPDHMPLFVLTATEHSMSPEQEQSWQAWQLDLALLSSNSVHQILEGADHASFWRDPATVKITGAAILQVVEAARTGEPLTSK